MSDVGCTPEALLSPCFTLHIYFSFIPWKSLYSYVCVCVCMNAVWTQHVLDCVISKPELSQVETLLRLRPPGINFSL